jgi:hypothetical protein
MCTSLKAKGIPANPKDKEEYAQELQDDQISLKKLYQTYQQQGYLGEIKQVPNVTPEMIIKFVEENMPDNDSSRYINTINQFVTYKFTWEQNKEEIKQLPQDQLNKMWISLQKFKKPINESQQSDIQQLILNNPSIADVYKNMAKDNIQELINFVAQQAQGLDHKWQPTGDKDTRDGVEIIFGKKMVDKCIELASNKLNEIKQLPSETKERIEKILEWAKELNEKNPNAINLEKLKFHLYKDIKYIKAWEDVMNGFLDASGSMDEIKQFQGGGSNMPGFMIKEKSGFKYPEFQQKPSELKHNSKFIRAAVLKLRDLNKDQLSGRMYDDNKFWNNRIAQLKRYMNDDSFISDSWTWGELFDILITHIRVEGGYFMRQAIKNLAQQRDQNLDEGEDNKNTKRELLKNFLKYCIEDLQLEKPYPRIHLTTDKSQTETYGHFDPNNKTIVVYTKGRGLGDIMRTIAHELVHRRQDQDQRITADSGETGSPIENEANSYAGVLLRNFGQKHKQIFVEHLQNEIKQVGNKITAENTNGSINFIIDSYLYLGHVKGDKVYIGLIPFQEKTLTDYCKKNNIPYQIDDRFIIPVIFFDFNTGYSYTFDTKELNEIKQLPGQQYPVNREEFHKLLDEIKNSFGDRIKDLKIPERRSKYDDRPEYFQYGSLYNDHLSFNFYLDNPTDEDKHNLKQILDNWIAHHQNPKNYPNNQLWGDFIIHNIPYGTEPSKGTGFYNYETNVRCSINRQFISSSGGNLEEYTQKLTEALLEPFQEIKQSQKLKAKPFYRSDNDRQNNMRSGFEIEGTEWLFGISKDHQYLTTLVGWGESQENIYKLSNFFKSKGIPYKIKELTAGDIWYIPVSFVEFENYELEEIKNFDNPKNITPELVVKVWSEKVNKIIKYYDYDSYEDPRPKELNQLHSIYDEYQQYEREGIVALTNRISPEELRDFFLKILKVKIPNSKIDEIKQIQNKLEGKIDGDKIWINLGTGFTKSEFLKEYNLYSFIYGKKSQEKLRVIQSLNNKKIPFEIDEGGSIDVLYIKPIYINFENKT